MGKIAIGAVWVMGQDDITGFQLKAAGEQVVAPGRHIAGGLTVDQAAVGKFEGPTERVAGKCLRQRHTGYDESKHQYAQPINQAAAGELSKRFGCGLQHDQQRLVVEVGMPDSAFM